jgi:hypothetical protein
MLHTGPRFVATFYALKIAAVASEAQSFYMGDSPLGSGKKLQCFELVPSVKAARRMLLSKRAGL